MLYKVVKKLWADFFALRLWRCSGHLCNKQQSYGQIDVTVGFSRSERSGNNLDRNSDCSERCFTVWKKWIKPWALRTQSLTRSWSGSSESSPACNLSLTKPTVLTWVNDSSTLLTSVSTHSILTCYSFNKRYLVMSSNRLNHAHWHWAAVSACLSAVSSKIYLSQLSLILLIHQN